MGDERGVSRREALKLGAAAIAVAACSGDDEVLPVDAAVPPDGPILQIPDAAPGPDAAPAPDAYVGPDGGPPDADLPVPDAAPPLSPAELLAPIETIVVLMMENRSFDHYLGALKLVEGRAVDGLTATMANPAPSGASIQVHELDDFTPEDPPHGWDACHAQWNDGAMDGFVKAHAGSSESQVMGYHVREQIPITYALADAFTVCDRWFCSVLGPTWPNRFFLHGASSGGQKSNLPVPGFENIWDQLADAGKSGTNYYADIAWAAGGYFKLGGLATVQKFFDDAAAGTLPNLAIVDPAFFGGGANDDHPDHDIRLGQAFIASIYAALRQSPQWDRTLFVVTYDEHGGFFDHVPPPEADDERADFRRMGVRVPTLVAGGVVRRGEIVSTVLEHSSVARTVAVRHGLADLNQRAAAAGDLSACIDPALIGAPLPGPALPPPPPISLSALRARHAAVAGRRPTHHTELWDAAERGLIPRALDGRARGLETALAWLSAGERLGALRLTK